MPKRNSSARWFELAALSLILVGFAYANSIHNPFHFDDSHSIAENIWIRSFEHWTRFFTDVSVFSPLAENRAYRPALLLSFAFSHWLGDGALWGFHVVSVALHAVGAFAVGAITLRCVEAAHPDDRPGIRFLGRDGPLWAGLAACAVFAVHPLLSESVNYVSARSSLQAAVFMFLAFWAYVEGRQRRSKGLLALVPALLLVAMATKIIAMTLPALLIAWELVLGPDRSKGVRRVLRAAAMGLVPTVIVAFGFTVFHESFVDQTSMAGRSVIAPWSYFLTETQVWLHYMGLYLWPEDLNVDLVMRWSEQIWEGPVARALMLNAVVVGAALVLLPKAPVLSFGLFWYYVALSPTNSIVPLSEPASEHRVYIAMPGLVLATVAALRVLIRQRLPTPRRFAAVFVAAGMLVGALAVRTYLRNRVWATEESLWADAAARSPTNGRAHMNYGLALMAQGRLGEANDAYDRCIQHWPEYFFCYLNRAALNLHLKRFDIAEDAIQTAEKLRFENVYVAEWRGRLELQVERWSAAEEAFQRALAIAPRYAPATRGLALALFEQGELEGSLPLLVGLEEDNELDADGAFALGYIAGVAGERQEARRAYELALFKEPEHHRAAYNLAVLDHEDGRLDEAIARYERLVGTGDAPEVIDNLVRAYWARGAFDRAREWKEELEQAHPRYPGTAKLPF